MEATRKHLDGLLAGLPALLQRSSEGASSLAHALLPDGIFVGGRAKRIVVRADDEEDEEEGDDNGAAASAGAGASAAIHKRARAPAAVGGAGGDAEETADLQAHGGDDDDDEDDDEDLPERIYADTLCADLEVKPTTRLHRSRVSGLVIVPSSTSASSTLLLEVHSGFGSIAVDSLRSDYVARIRIPVRLESVVRMLTGLGPDAVHTFADLVSLYGLRRKASVGAGAGAGAGDKDAIPAAVADLVRALVHTGFLLTKPSE